jgi:hypothetical protein
MSDDELHYGKPIDDDYIDVDKQRADVAPDEQSTEPERYYDELPPSNKPEPHALDYAEGNGAASSLDELIDQNAIIENDGRSNTRTFFYPFEADDESTYSRLIRWQDGEGSPSRKEDNRGADRKRWVETFGAQLSLTDFQIERTKHVLDTLPLAHMAHYSTEKVICAIISLVADEDGRFIRDELAYKRLVDDIDSGPAEVRSIRELVKRKSDAF